MSLGLGRCVCVTPELVNALEERLADVTNQRDAEWGLLTSDARMEAYVRLCDMLNVARFDDVGSAVQAVLVSLGHPAVPAGALGNLALEHLVSITLD